MKPWILAIALTGCAVGDFVPTPEQVENAQPVVDFVATVAEVATPGGSIIVGAIASLVAGAAAYQASAYQRSKS